MDYIYKDSIIKKQHLLTWYMLSPISQTTPLHPMGQVQTLRPEQVPPFWHIGLHVAEK